MYKSSFTSRLTRTAISLGIVIALYCAYTLTAVPMIEPPLAVRAGGKKASSEDIEKARNIHLPYLELFAAYFPKDHWVHQNPKVLVNDAAMLLIKDYNPLPDGQVELNPCVMIFFPQQRSDSFEPQRQALILEAPQGAILEFADGFDLSQAKIGRLSHGHLRGEVTIRSDMSDPGPEDDLLVRTREIQLTEDRIWTEHDVKFRVGENSGHGTRMEIRLLPNERRGGSAGMNVAGVQSMQLLRNVKMNLVMGKSGLLPEEGLKEPTPADGKEEPGPPVEITCRGPFIFDLVRHIATFEDHVDVIRFNPTGTSDQMTCELLAIHFLPDDEKAQAMEKQGESSPKGMKPLRPKMLEARGEPVVVRSPSTGGQARCERLRYDLESRTIALDGTDEIMLFQGTNEIHAPALQYQPSETPGGLGMVWAAGPGWLRAAADDDPSKIFEARWQQELHLRRHEGEHVISVRGRPQLGMVGMGGLTADEVHLWMKEVPQTATNAADTGPAKESETNQPQPKIEPDRLLASGSVLIDSESLTANTGRMEAWFKQLGGGQLASTSPKPSRNPADPQPDAGLQPVRGPNQNQPPPADNPNANGANPAAVVQQRLKPKYNLRGELIRLQVAMTEEETHVTDATVSGQVNLQETQTAQPNEKPLIIQGDKLQLTKAHLPETYVAVSGKPAVVLARGLTMQGGMVELNRGDNRLWINGPGSMTLPANRDLRGEATETEQTLTINWRGKMDFNGLVVEFQEDVIGRADNQLLRTGRLKAELMEKVDFSTAAKDSNTEMRRITCEDGVYLENQTIVEGERTSVDKMTTQDLTIDQTTGNIFGNGPGWLTSLRRGGAGGENPLGGAALVQAASTPAAGEGAADELKYLRVDFRRALEGNTIKKEIAFTGEARAVYGPVANWDDAIDPDDPRGLGERDVMLNTDRLKVTEMDTMRNGRKTMELEALGNTLVEGQTFTARAERMAYAQAKELLVLEGTAKTDAQLWRQPHVGAAASHAAARKILFWRDTNRVEINDARYFGSQFGGGKK